MTYDEDVQAVQEYIQACAKLLRIKVSALGCLEIAEKYMAKYEGSRARVMVQVTPLSLHDYIHNIMSEDIRTAEEIREELAMSTRQYPLELHPEDIAAELFDNEERRRRQLEIEDSPGKVKRPMASWVDSNGVRQYSGDTSRYGVHVAPQECDYDCPSDCAGDIKDRA